MRFDGGWGMGDGGWGMRGYDGWFGVLGSIL